MSPAMTTYRVFRSGGVPDFLTVEEAAAVLRIGRTAAYPAAREFLATDGASGLPVARFGRQLRVPRPALERVLGGPMSWPGRLDGAASSSARADAADVARSDSDDLADVDSALDASRRPLPARSAAAAQSALPLFDGR